MHMVMQMVMAPELVLASPRVPAAAGCRWLASRATLPCPSVTTSDGGSGSGSGTAPTVTLQARVRELKDYTTICCSAPSEVLALIGLRASRAIVGGHLETISANADTFGAFVARFPRLLSWARPAAGSVAFPRLLAPVHVQAFCERCVAGCGVLLLPASVYDHAPSVAKGHFRIGLARANLPECLAVLGVWLESREADLLAGRL
jgi:aspartate/methionine/tyrosine aminotransferase